MMKKIDIFSGFTLASLYCNRATREAFFQLFTEFMDAVQQVTGKPLKIKEFCDEGILRCFIFDAEVAQVQGFGDWLIQSQPHDKLKTTNPLKIVQYVMKTCSVHFSRYVVNECHQT
jgi:hypothetical protein